MDTKERVVSGGEYATEMIASAKSGTRAISRSWVVTNNGAEIATITMSITTLSDFQEDYIGELLKRFAGASHSFYLEAGNKLKTGP